MKAILRTLCGCEKRLEVGKPPHLVRVALRRPLRGAVGPDEPIDAAAEGWLPCYVREFECIGTEDGVPVYMERGAP